MQDISDAIENVEQAWALMMNEYCTSDDDILSCEKERDAVAAMLQELGGRRSLDMDTTKALADFAQWALENGPFNGCDLDGSSVQDKAIALGLIEPDKVRPDWLVYSAAFKAARK